MYRAWFINNIGHEFSREFDTSSELDDFIERAEIVRTKLIAYVSDSTVYGNDYTPYRLGNRSGESRENMKRYCVLFRDESEDRVFASIEEAIHYAKLDEGKVFDSVTGKIVFRCE